MIGGILKIPAAKCEYPEMDPNESGWLGLELLTHTVRIERPIPVGDIATCVGERLVEPLVVLEVQVRADPGSNQSAHHVLMSVFRPASEYEAQPTIVSPVTTTG